jgi:hypothetical protein
MELKIIYLANQLVRRFGYSLSSELDQAQEKATKIVRKQLNIDDDKIADLQQRLSVYLEQIETMLQPQERVSLF